MDEITLKLNSPITEEQWDDITDVDFEHTDRIWFHTKHDKDVEFVKVLLCKDCKFYRECGCQRAFVYPEPDDFCSRAERRNDGRKNE